MGSLLHKIQAARASVSGCLSYKSRVARTREEATVPRCTACDQDSCCTPRRAAVVRFQSPGVASRQPDIARHLRGLDSSADVDSFFDAFPGSANCRSRTVVLRCVTAVRLSAPPRDETSYVPLTKGRLISHLQDGLRPEPGSSSWVLLNRR